MIDTSSAGWDDHEAKIDARVIELGMAEREAEADLEPER